MYYPLTSPQKRIIINQQIYPKGKFSYMYGFVEIKDKSLADIKSALNDAIAYFDCLRIKFLLRENKIVQEITSFIPKEFIIKDLTDDFHSEKFFLFEADLYKFFLIDGKKKGYYFIFHHAIIDAYGIALITNYIERRLISKDININRHSYVEFINREQAYLKSLTSKEDEHFFEEILLESNERQYIISDNIAANRVSLEFSKDESEELLSFCKNLKISVFKLIYAATFLSLYEFFDKRSITISTTHHNRLSHERDLSGICASTIPLVMGYKYETYGSFLNRCVALLDSSLDRHQFVIDGLITKLSKDDAFMLSPTKFIINSLPFSGSIYPITRFSPNEDVTELNFKLNPNLKPKGSNLEIAVDYRCSLYKKEEAEGILKKIKGYAKNFVSKRDIIIEIPGAKGFIDKVVENIRNNKEVVALVDDNEALSYHELDLYSNSVAQIVKNEHSIIGILNERTVWFYVALLGVLKAGKAFVVLGNSLKEKMLNSIIADTKVNMILKYDDSLVPFFASKEQNIKALELLADFKVINGDIAYVMYTSGSTGMPKGAIITTTNLLAFYQSLSEIYQNTLHSRILASCSLEFDGSLIETMLAFKTSSTLFIANEKVRKDIKLTHQLVKQNSIKHLIFTTRFGQLYNEEYPNEMIDTLMLAGDMMTYYHEDTKYQIINGYGPTECTVLSHYQIINRKMDEYPFGKPFSQYYEKLIPSFDDKYELLVIGPNVGMGYLNNYKLTKDKFFVDEKTNYRGYYTGDIVKQNKQKENIFVSRRDRQIKYNGFRVELDAIDSLAKTYPNVYAAYTIYHNNHMSHYVVGKIKLSEYKKFLADNLPYYMYPKTITKTKKITYTASDKPSVTLTKKRALGNYQKKRLLNLIRSYAFENLTYQDDFMSYGINSIDLIELILKIEKEFKVSLLITDLYSYSTTDKLYHYLNSQKDAKNISLIRKGKNAPIMIFFDLSGDISSYKSMIDSINKETPILSVNANNINKYASVEDFIDEVSLELKRDYNYQKYTLIGYSGGGTFAMELAKKLDKQSLLYLIDTPNYAKYPIKLNAVVKIALRNSHLVFKLRGFSKMIKYIGGHIKQILTFNFLKNQKKIMNLLNKYQPQSDDDYTLFVSKQSINRYKDLKIGHNAKKTHYLQCSHGEIMLSKNVSKIIKIIEGEADEIN